MYAHDGEVLDVEDPPENPGPEPEPIPEPVVPTNLKLKEEFKEPEPVPEPLESEHEEEPIEINSDTEFAVLLRGEPATFGPAAASAGAAAGSRLGPGDDGLAPSPALPAIAPSGSAAFSGPGLLSSSAALGGRSSVDSARFSAGGAKCDRDAAGSAFCCGRAGGRNSADRVSASAGDSDRSCHSSDTANAVPVKIYVAAGNSSTIACESDRAATIRATPRDSFSSS
ncbi:uncharacterized protein LOC130137986 [Syzygium oleosum]|uniref:uncharacterized protein LOC130137986 n=1 Tax=Syzygium oleosum TaxID=219896 RepID=UPI0024BA562E|nr:uncharacterized protein LOC130137986 [Syzygium oleosum]